MVLANPWRWRPRAAPAGYPNGRHRYAAYALAGRKGASQRPRKPQGQGANLRPAAWLPAMVRAARPNL